MRLLLHCSNGKSHTLMVTQPTRVWQVKEFLAGREGVPAAQQTLLFAGCSLPDEGLLEEHLHLDMYSLAQEVVLYMVPSLGAPRPVHLCGPPGDRGNSLAVQPQVELVEASSSLANIMALLHTRQLTGGSFLDEEAGSQPSSSTAAASNSSGTTLSSSSSGGVTSTSSNIVVKRSDGTTITRVTVSPATSIAGLEQLVAQAEGWPRVHHLTFYQARDHCLHILTTRGEDSTDPSSAPQTSDTLYQGAEGQLVPEAAERCRWARSMVPQPVMPVKPVGPEAMPLTQLVQEVAVVP